jgi:hypothetical protein
MPTAGWLDDGEVGIQLEEGPLELAYAGFAVGDPQ